MELPTEIHDKFHEFVNRLNELVNEVFSEDIDTFSIVVGAQWGDLGGSVDNGLPPCLVTSNLPICLVPEALDDMLHEAERMHDEVHGDSPRSGQIAEAIEFDRLPAEVQTALREKLDSLGLSPDEVAFAEVIDTSDLSDLPETEG